MLLIAFILCTVSTQLGSLSVNVQRVSILLAKNKNVTKTFSLCVYELGLSAKGKGGNFISYHLLLLTQMRGWLMKYCSEQFPFYQRSLLLPPCFRRRLDRNAMLTTIERCLYSLTTSLINLKSIFCFSLSKPCVHTRDVLAWR